MLSNTKLPELWCHYVRIAEITPITDSGRSLAGASAYLLGAEIDATHQEFWDAMLIFLDEQNAFILEKLEK